LKHFSHFKVFKIKNIYVIFVQIELDSRDCSPPGYPYSHFFNLFHSRDEIFENGKLKHFSDFKVFKIKIIRVTFVQIELDFLPPGHSHDDIDQVFSKFSTRLKINDVRVVSDMITICEASTSPKPVFKRLEKV
jgi:hypothetical protein